MQSSRLCSIAVAAVAVLALILVISLIREDEAPARQHFESREFAELVKDNLVLSASVDELRLTGQYRKGNEEVALYEVEATGETELNFLLNELLSRNVTVIATGAGRPASNRAG